MNAMTAHPWDGLPLTGPICRPAHAASYVGLSIGHYYELVKPGGLPPFIKLGPRASGVPLSHLDAFLASREGRCDG